MNIKLSIVIPVYNTERQIERCLDSVIKEEGDYYEVVCVDDGSTDSSFSILENYRRKDNRIRVVKLSSNRGLSYARNKGLEEALGEYIWFVDSDDYIIEGAVEKIISAMESGELDCLLFDCEYKCEGINYYPFQGQRRKRYDGICSGKEILTMQLNTVDYDVTAFRQCWRKAFLIENRLEYIEGIIHEDVAFTFKALLLADRVKCIQEKYYVYVRRDESLSTKKNYSEKVRSFVISLVDMNRTFDERVCDESLAYKVGQHFSRIKRETIRIAVNGIYDGSFSENIRYSENKYKVFHYDLFMVGKVSLIYIARLLAANKEKKVKVFGAGRIGRDVVTSLGMLELDDFEVVVSRKTQDKICGIPIKELNELDNKSDTFFIISTDSKYHDDIIRDLEKRGFYNYKCWCS